MLVSDVLDDVRKTYLNDTSGTIYTDNVLLPFIQSAYSALQTEFLLNGLQSLSEFSAVIDVTAGTTSLSVPSDFVSPIKLQERADGGTADDWVDMTELRHDYEQTDSTTLNYWTFREDGIYVGPATTNRDVKLYYYKSLTVSSINSTIPIIGADEFLELELHQNGGLGRVLHLADEPCPWSIDDGPVSLNVDVLRLGQTDLVLPRSLRACSSGESRPPAKLRWKYRGTSTPWIGSVGSC